MNQIIIFVLLVLVVFVAKLAWSKFFSTSAPLKASTESEDAVSNFADIMLVNSLKVAIGFLDRGVSRADWESNLQGMHEVLTTEGRLDEDSATFLINASRDLLNEHGDNPDMLRAMLEAAENGFPEDATT